MPTVKVCSLPMCRLAMAAMMALSSPPDRKTPRGTSLISRLTTARSNVSRIFLTQDSIGSLRKGGSGTV